jgi:hypothetical protein
MRPARLASGELDGARITEERFTRRAKGVELGPT